MGDRSTSGATAAGAARTKRGAPQQAGATPSAPRRRERSAGVAQRQADRRDDRLAAAQQIVVERGLAGLTAASLAEATGTVPAALYRTFPSMDALKGQLVARALDRLAASLERRVGARPHGPDAKRAALARVHAVAAFLPVLRRARPADHQLIDAALSSLTPVFSDEVAAHVEAHLQRVLAIAAATIDDAVDAGALAPGDGMQRALVLTALVHGVDHLRKRDRLEPASRHAARVLDEGVRALLIGWGAPPALAALPGGVM